MMTQRDIIAGGKQEIILQGEQIEIDSYNSFSVPVIVAKVCEILSENADATIAEIREDLKGGGLKSTYKYHNSYKTPDHEIPVVLVEQNEKLANYLKIRFCKMGYFAVHIRNSQAKGYTAPEIDVEIKQVEQIYNCDIIIADVSKHTILQDINISMHNDAVEIKTLDDEIRVCKGLFKRKKVLKTVIDFLR